MANGPGGDGAPMLSTRMCLDKVKWGVYVILTKLHPLSSRISVPADLLPHSFVVDLYTIDEYIAFFVVAFPLLNLVSNMFPCSSRYFRVVLEESPGFELGLVLRFA